MLTQVMFLAQSLITGIFTLMLKVATRCIGSAKNIFGMLRLHQRENNSVLISSSVYEPSTRYKIMKNVVFHTKE